MKALKKALGGGSKAPGERRGPLSGKPLQVGQHALDVGALLGSGGFADVYRALDTTTGRSVALKHFRLSGDPEAVRAVQTEVAIMKALRDCPYIVHLVGVAYSGPPGAEVEAVVLMDLAAQPLPSVLAQLGPRLDEATLLRVFLHVCRAVQAMHALDPPVVHRRAGRRGDIKAENVLQHPSGAWQLCDFGSASARVGVLESAAEIGVEEDVIRKTTTPAYRAPELWDLWSRQPIGPPGDIWALGCLLYLLCFGQLPFDGTAKLEIFNARYALPGGRPEALRQLISSMLVPDPLARPDINAVVAAVERLAAAAAPDITRPLPAAVQQAVQQEQLRQQQAHAQALSPDWRALAGSRTPSDTPGQTPPMAPAPAAGPASGGGGGQFAGWASFDSPKQKPPQQETPQAPQPQPQQPRTAGAFWDKFDAPGAVAIPAPVATATPPPAASPAAAVAPAVAAAAVAAATNPPARVPAATPPPRVPSPPADFAGPLSAGAAHLQRTSGGAASASSMGDEQLGPRSTGSSAAAALEVEALRSSVTQLQEYARVLEGLLESRNSEVAALKAEMERLKAGQWPPAAQHSPLAAATVTPRPAQLPPLDLNPSGAPATDAPTPTWPGSRANGSGAGGSQASAFAAAATEEMRARLQLGSAARAGSGASTPSQGGSPMRARPGGRDSPTKQSAHRRQLSAPQTSFFHDLNPLA
eukprot:scaffold2.g7529.t1